MKVTIYTARLIENGGISSMPVRICEEGLSFEADSPEAAQQRIEQMRTQLLALVLEELEKQPDMMKEGAVYTIDFNYTLQS